jgi:hypothetical protein
MSVPIRRPTYLGRVMGWRKPRGCELNYEETRMINVLLEHKNAVIYGAGGAVGGAGARAFVRERALVQAKVKA